MGIIAVLNKIKGEKVKDEKMKEDLFKPVLIEDLGLMFPKENSIRTARFGIYKCGFCGNEFRTQTSSVKNGNTMSCGCYRKLKKLEYNKKHGMTDIRLYGIWGDIKDRALNPKHNHYINYGGRGITICDEWKNDFKSFYDWSILNGYEENKSLSIDRIDNDGNYCPDNCRWTTRIIQGRNRRIRKDNTSGYKGVSYYKKTGRYGAKIRVNKKRIHLGYFQTAVEAGIAYNNYILENNLEGFILNKIEI